MSSEHTGLSSVLTGQNMSSDVTGMFCSLAVTRIYIYTAVCVTHGAVSGYMHTAVNLEDLQLCTVELSETKFGTLPPLVLGGIIENQNSDFVTP